MILVAATPGGELDIRPTLRARLCAEAAGLDRYLFDGAKAHGNGNEKHCPAALETVRGIVYAVNRYVYGAPGQVVISRVTACGRLRALSKSRQIESVTATAERQFGHCF